MAVAEGAPQKTVNVKELFAGKKGILFAVPGAFTPACNDVCLLMKWEVCVKTLYHTYKNILSNKLLSTYEKFFF